MKIASTIGLCILVSTAACMAVGCSSDDNGGGDDNKGSAGSEAGANSEFTPARARQLAEEFCEVEYACSPDNYESEEDCVESWVADVECYLPEISAACKLAVKASSECQAASTECGMVVDNCVPVWTREGKTCDSPADKAVRTACKK